MALTYIHTIIINNTEIREAALSIKSNLKIESKADKWHVEMKITSDMFEQLVGELDL